MDRHVGNKPELNRTAISWKCAPIVPAFVFRVWWIRRRDLFTDKKVFRCCSVLCENAYTNIVGGEPRCLMCLKAQVCARDVAGDCDAGRSVFRFALTHALTHMEECSVCSVTLVMWLLSLFVMFLTLTSPRGPACHTNKWLFPLCIVHFLKRGYFWTREAKTSCNEWCNVFPVSINCRRSNAWARNKFMHSWTQTTGLLI